MKKHIEVVAAIIYEQNKVLATRRAYGEFEDMWEFPGGKIEAGENPEEALIREIKEELELDIAIDDFLITVEHEYESFFLTMHCYNAHVEGGEMALHAHNAVKWLAINELDQVEWLPADIAVVEAIEKSHS